jgi:branched-chain amino acid transport system ATP-binding protein
MTIQPLLELRGLRASYGQGEALHGIDLTVGAGEMVAVLGPNGAGKSTLLRAIMGQVWTSGGIVFEGEPVEAQPTRGRAARGMVMVPEGRGIFGPMTVEENLSLGAWTRRGDTVVQRQLVLELFPRLRERLGQMAGSLSGGEQQMLAIGRALMVQPRLLMLDEPSLGLAPRLAASILDALGELNRSGLGILLVEQRAPLALRLARRTYVLRLGDVVAQTEPSETITQGELGRLYLA